MKFQHIKELIELIDEKEISSIDIEKEDIKISIKKEITVNNTEPNIYTEKPTYKHHINTKEVHNEIENMELESNIADDAFVVKSPIVGTFYSAASPDVSDYVKLGDRVTKGDTLCIIEAMKLMNDIDAEVSGEIIEILVKNEDVVEYGQPLFKIKK